MGAWCSSYCRCRYECCPCAVTKHAQGIADAAAARMKDSVSHFVVRLALCRHIDGRAWLLHAETELFRYRCYARYTAITHH